MSRQPQNVDASFYAIIEPQWSNYWTDDKDRAILSGAKVSSITQKKPTKRIPAGALVTKLTLRVDSNALLPLQPEAVIAINAGNTELIEVTVDALESGDE